MLYLENARSCKSLTLDSWKYLETSSGSDSEWLFPESTEILETDPWQSLMTNITVKYDYSIRTSWLIGSPKIIKNIIDRCQ